MLIDEIKRQLIGESFGGRSEPPKYTLDDLNKVMIQCYELGISDVLLQSGEPICVSYEGEWLRAGDRPMLVSEIQFLLCTMYNQAAYAALASGQEQIFRYEVRKDRSTVYGFRCSATAIISASAGDNGIEIVMRAIPAVAPPLDALQIERELEAAFVPQSGLVLVTGPTGSGKSTLLAAVLRKILTSPPGRHILTYENPVEFILRNVPNRVGVVAQSEIPKNLPSFSAGVANALRRKGEIILIGEARDEATIRGVIEAAQTGHLVYSTVHTNDVASTVTRMADSFGLEQAWPVALKIIDATRLIVHQRLAPGPRLADGGRGKRVAVREFLVFSEDIRRALMGAGPAMLQLKAREFVLSHGQSMVSHANSLLKQGVIDEYWVESLEAQYQAEADSLRKIAKREAEEARQLHTGDQHGAG